jgi:hypothetical protein
MDEPHTQDDPTKMSRADRAKLEELLPRTPCSACGKPVVFASRPNGSRAPLDPRAQVFLVTRRGGMPFATTFKEFQAKAVSITVKMEDGSTETYPASAILSLMVTHFATCPKGSQFSGQNKQPNPNLPHR